MRHLRGVSAVGGLLLAGALVGCSNDALLGLNANPNNPTDAPAGPLFTNATNATVGRFRGATYDFATTSLFAQHFAQVQYPEGDQYKVRTGNIDGFFLTPYSSELEDYRKVALKGQAAKQAGTYGPALIMKSWVFGILTDTFGDIPYSQALIGDSVGTSVTPAYDPQQQVYAGIFADLTTAAKDLAGATNTLGTADAIYGGAPAKWQRFANSMRARYALREIKADPSGAATQLAAALNAPGGVFTSNADNAQLVWPGDGINDNPYASNLKSRDDNRMSKTLIDTLSAYSDPRLTIYAQPAASDGKSYVGLQNGLSTAAASPFLKTTSRPGAIFYAGATAYGTFGNASNAKTPSYLMTYAEVALIKAEAAERGIAGLTAAQAKGFYEDGIRASMGQWGVTDATAIAAYIAKTGIVYKGGAEGLRQIALQKWLALFGEGSEAWAEYRRTGVPALVKGPAASASVAGVPRRLPYSTQEQSINAASRAAAVARQGTDDYNTRVWWDK
ncbi:MAG: SusD/RagB family nutrient-binding outer membrane lipoprotein [Gemmatirosa sp.]|nr:SusD/RagB family nutrient-binding outer membrane lipoprotein [Gemmatirosa sp.]